VSSRVSLEALSLFTRQFSAMLDAGIPLAQALAFFSEGEGGPLPKTMAEVTARVVSGAPLSLALRSHPEVFSEVYVALVETGESSGRIVTIFQRLSDLLEKQVRMRKKLVATLTYPAILLTVSLLCIAVFVLFILPMIEPVFRSLRVQLPLPTRILLGFRTFFGPACLGTGLLSLAAWLGRPHWRAYLERNDVLHRQLAHFPLQLPLVGPVLQKLIVARVLYALASMLEAGIGLVQALGRCGAVSGNEWVKHRIGVVARGLIVDGDTVSQAFYASQVFPPSAVALVAIGEETSSLGRMLQYTASMHEEDAEAALTMASQALEPLLMAGMGVIVGFIVVSAMLPLLQLVSTL